MKKKTVLKKSEESKSILNIKPKVTNMVCTVDLGCVLDLRKIALKTKNSEYNPKVLLNLKEISCVNH